ncbi:tetratricopeptide repeat protein [Yinghuangia soli]|uniref:Tetratricopeptide repeat protein n=1 Tax=Yinghuangia soli TaxID=2908204 RepID=A0AA41Q4G0_9ACTN|nr:tetratricopeptide repeat protein [Yinghuangia soli]MCF2530259.1 tetratricopeptide repeat protein [Yinghuangia soli]
MSADGRIHHARVLYERAVFAGDSAALAAGDRELDAVEADLALARGRITHARYLAERVEDPDELVLFDRAAALYRSLGNIRGEAEALFWVATFHQVVRGDTATALPVLERSLELAAKADDRSTMAYALRHLGIAAHMAGDLGTARQHLEASTRLRREIGMLPGVAANLVGLAHIAHAQGRAADTAALLAEAEELTRGDDAQGVRRWVDEARAELRPPA